MHIWALTMAAALAMASAALAATTAPAENYLFPQDKGVVDVTKPPYSAPSDGKTDATAAIQKALDENIGAIVWLPNGKYLISDTIKWPGRQSDTTLWGQSTDGVVLKLKDSCPGYTDAKKPKAMVWTGQKPAQRFKNYIRSLTFDTGTGNAGAIGAQFISNNSGAFREVVIRSGDGKGAIGLDLGYTDEQGPCLIKNVKVVGFDIGISCRTAVDSIVMEHVTLQKQNVVGLRNGGQCISIRGLNSDNAVPAFENTGGSSVAVLLDSTLTGSGEAAIVNDKAVLFARNIDTKGYKEAIRNNAGEGKGAAGPKVDEFVSHPVISAFGPAGRSLNLPIKETPQVPWGDASQWVSVLKFRDAAATTDDAAPILASDFGDIQLAQAKKGGAKGGGGAPAGGKPAGGPPAQGGDIAAALQKAIDSGARTVYVPMGSYTIGRDVQIRGKVERIIGLGQQTAIRGEGKFIFADGDAPVVVIEGLQGTGKGLHHAAKRTLVLRNMAVQALGGFRTSDGVTSEGTGDFYVEDVVGAKWQIGKQNFWARQLNTEPETTKVTNKGGDVWILGLKTERGSTIVHNIAGRAEVCGGFSYTTTEPGDAPMFINDGGCLSVTMGESFFKAAPAKSFDPIVKETQGGQTKIIGKDAFPKRGGGVAIPLYVGCPPK